MLRLTGEKGKEIIEEHFSDLIKDIYTK